MRTTVLAVAAISLAVTAPAAAQSGFVVGVDGGITLPMGNANDVLKTGWGGGVTLMMRNPDARVGWGIEAQFHRLAYDQIAGIDPNANLNSYGAMARLDFSAGGKLYLLGGAGLFRNEVTGGDNYPDFGDTSNTDFAVEGGLGLNFGRGLFLEGKYINIFTDNDNTQMIPITIGIRF